MSGAKMLWRVASFAVAAGFIALWQLIANLKLVSPVFLPGPDRAWASLVRGFSSGDLLTKLLGSGYHRRLVSIIFSPSIPTLSSSSPPFTTSTSTSSSAFNCSATRAAIYLAIIYLTHHKFRANLSP